MATRLGPAILPLALDTESARRDLDELEQRYRRILGQRREERREDETSTRKGREEVQQSRRTRQKMTTEARTGRFGPAVTKLAALGAGLVGGALLFEKFATGISGAVAESLEGTPIAEQVSQAVDAATRDLSNQVSELASRMSALIPSAIQTTQILNVRRMLGEKAVFGGGLQLAEVIYEVNETLTRAQRQKTKIAMENAMLFFPDLISPVR